MNRVFMGGKFMNISSSISLRVLYRHTSQAVHHSVKRRMGMGDAVGAIETKIAPAAERVIPETYSLVNDTFNISGSNIQFKVVARWG